MMLSKVVSSRREFSAFAMPAQPAVNSLTPAEITEEIQATMAKMQEANDAMLTEVKAMGKEDVVTREKVDRINAHITELKTALDDSNKQIGRLTVGGAAAGADQTQAANAARFMTFARGEFVAPGEASDIEAYADYRKAFAAMVRAGGNPIHLSQEFRNALSIGSDPAGGYLVPVEQSNEMEKRIHDDSPMRRLSRVITISGESWEAPWKTATGVSGGWVGEKQQRPATDTPTIGLQVIPVHEQYAYPEVTQKMLDNPTTDTADMVTDDTHDEMIRTENAAYVAGDGSMKPRGFVSYAATAVTTKDANRKWGLLQYKATGAAGAFPTLTGGAANPDVLIDTITSMNKGYRAGAVWGMNSTVEAAVRKLKDGDGRYLVNFGSIEGGLSFNLFGYKMETLEDMPDLGSDSFSMAFGNFKRGYLIIDKMGFRLLIDPYTNKPYVGFYITRSTGGDVRNFDAFKLVKFSS